MPRKDNMHLNASPEIFARANELRKRMTPSEKKLWEHLRKRKLLGLKFRRQHPTIKYILDFYCASLKICIEIDGKIHDGKYHEFYDQDRTNNLNEQGIEVIRFTNQQVLNDIENVLTELSTFCRKVMFEKHMK